MRTLSEFCLREYGEKLYRLSLNGGFTCPNRDGTLDSRGCIFCSAGGSGEFAGDPGSPLELQIEEQKKRVAGKFRGDRYIAYFQAYTNTYGPVEVLRTRFTEVLRREDVAVLSIATRPDCISEETYGLLSELRREKPVWVELGLQTVKEASVRYIRRGYENEVYLQAVRRLRAMDIHVVTHVILGLPGESTEDMKNTVRYALEAGSSGIKLQLLQILRGTDLAENYRKGEFAALTEEAYLSCLEACLSLLPEDCVVHRMTGDGPRNLLLAPRWSLDKKRIMNETRRIFEKIRAGKTN